MSTPLPNPSPDDLLLASLTKWRQLTRAEAAAIASQDWDALRGHQEEKAALQLCLEQVLSSPSNTPAAIAAARQFANELYSLEHENRALLALEIRKTKDQLASEDRSIHTLGQVRKVYAAPTHALWETYG